MSVLPSYLEQSCSLFLPCWSLDSVQTIYTRRAITRSRTSLRNPYLFLPLVSPRFLCSNIMFQACHDEISDINLIRKCKCKNFVTGLLAHSVLKSTQMAASLTGLHYHLHFRKISLCTTCSNYQFLAASLAGIHYYLQLRNIYANIVLCG